MNWWQSAANVPLSLPKSTSSLPLFLPSLVSLSLPFASLPSIQSSHLKVILLPSLHHFPHYVHGPSFPLTYCVCFSFLAVAVGWRGHLQFRWPCTGRRTRLRLSEAWARWAWKGGMAVLGVAPLLTGCRTGRGNARTAPLTPRGRMLFGCCVASSGAGRVGRWHVRTVRDLFDWAAESSTLGAAGVEERWSGGVKDAGRGRGKTTRCETQAGGSDTLLPVLGADSPQLTSPGEGSHNRGHSSLCCLKKVTRK